MGRDSAKTRTGVNVWGLLTVDTERGIVYMPFGAPSVGSVRRRSARRQSLRQQHRRRGREHRKYLWHFQVVHHDIWDGDLAGAPALVDVKQGGRTIPAVAVIDKMGLLFLLDR